MAMRHAKSAAVPAEFFLQLTHAVPDKLDTPVAPLAQAVENFAIEHERAVHAPALFQGGIERGMIERAQVASEPHQGNVVSQL
jgi:hypothetical protein